MDAETRTQNAITITRNVLRKALNSPFTMVKFTANGIDPERVEDSVYRVLCYLEKTAAKKPKEQMKDNLCPNDGEELHFFSKPIPVTQLFDPNKLEDCDWEGWEENKLGYIVAVCLKCDYILGVDNIQEGLGIDTIEEDVTRPYCACGRLMYQTDEGDEDAGPIYICRWCHKIVADGWKWG